MADARKTDYFGTFLDVLSRGAQQVAGNIAASHEDLTGAVIRTLAEFGGGSTLPALFTPPFTTMNSLMATVQTLESFGLVARDGAKIVLTEDGRAMAAKLAPPSGQMNTI